MINIINGDLMKVVRGFVVHGCNAQSVMGSGVAKLVKEKYPEAFELYETCLMLKNGKGESALGSNTYYIDEIDDVVVVNAVTQEFYGTDRMHTDYDAVRSCFRNLVKEIEEQQDKAFKYVPKVINFPLIGCGLGGGDWEVVSKIINEEVDDSFVKTLWVL